MGEFDDWGQEDFYCDGHVVENLVDGARIWILREEGNVRKV
jgi:hypothetical protein